MHPHNTSLLCPGYLKHMILRLVLIILNLSFSNGLIIKFNPSEKLTKFSSEISFDFFILMKNSFLKEENWPILKSFSKARYYNFPQVLAATFDYLQCGLTLRIIQSPNFPCDELLSANILTNPKLIPCFKLISDDFFWSILNKTPMESSKYKATHWDHNKHILFMQLSYTRPKIRTNWYSWCFDPELSLNYIEPSITWKVVNFNCIQTFPEIISSKLLEILSPTQELVNFNTQKSDSTVISRLSDLMNSIVYFPSNEDLGFAIGQIMKIVSISVYLIVFRETHELYIKAKFILKHYLENLKFHHKSFPLRRVLKRFIINLLAAPTEREPLTYLYSLLLTFLEVCRGEARGTWILNLYIIWNHFRGERHLTVNTFLDEFVEIFLNPESFTTIPDICLFLRHLNSIISESSDDYSVQERIFSKYLFSNIPLSKEIMIECPAEIPKSKRANNSVFPLSFRLEHLFQQARFIDNFSAPTVVISLKSPPERSCYSIFKLVNNFLDTEDTSDLPMNAKVMARNTFLDGNLPKMLELFFLNLMVSSNWFLNSNGPAIERPILLPSLTFPPQFMEYIGYLMGKAVISNVKLPFFIDKRYFKLPDGLDVKSDESPLPSITFMIREIYPDLNIFTSNLQVHRISSTLDFDFSAGRVLQFITENYVLGQLTFREPNIISNIPYSMYSIILMGSERLRIGLNRALPTELLTTNQLYNLIFK